MVGMAGAAPGAGSQGLVQKKAELLGASGLKCCSSDRGDSLSEVETWSLTEHCYRGCASSVH